MYSFKIKIESLVRAIYLNHSGCYQIFSKQLNKNFCVDMVIQLLSMVIKSTFGEAEMTGLPVTHCFVLTQFGIAGLPQKLQETSPLLEMAILLVSTKISCSFLVDMKKTLKSLPDQCIVLI